ncbi:GNAT family N-acetyltransferase [Nocardioides sp.]|uniref:GNAT family N-acetyltransferase n=1 Tax=Nocardioides sp. TaxID=35761 RepID=UPI003514334B
MSAAVPVLPERLQTERLRLILISPDDAAAMQQGRHDDVRWHPEYPRPDDVAAASMVRTGANTFGPRHIVAGTQAVGSIGFHAPPELAGEELEVGFGLVPAARGRGFAREALLALVGAVEERGLRVRASVAPDNRPSLRVLAACGFTDLRGSDEDGHLVMARVVTRP